ncbi:hypothetical protein BDV19DRAFT_378830 [Aspergillus venezuelensis]
MRRTEVACAECRRRKLKCEGTRPSCSRCQSFRLECYYKPPPQRSSRMARQGQDRDDLLKRIELLEEKLRGAAEQTLVSDTNGPPLAMLSSRQEDGTVSGQRTAVDDEVPVDILSTNALMEASDSEVGYFGPSSNYAMFRLVSRAFADTVMMYTPAGGTVQSLSPCHHCAERQEASRTGASSEERVTPTPTDMFTLPSKREGTDLLERFFSTIDPVLPYIDKPALIGEYHKSINQHPPRFRRVFLALLNIVWAHASASIGTSRCEAFYRRSVALLDSRTLERPSYELVQTLLLMVEYKQNHQRSISSYTTHALCVKAAFHIGLHSRTRMAGHRSEGKDLRFRLWDGKADNGRRIMGLTQGRPFMIPHSLRAVNTRISGEANSSIRDLYMAHLVSSHTIIDQTIETLYGGNLDLGETLKLQTLFSRWTDLSWHIGDWSDNLATIGGLVSLSELSAGSELREIRLAVRVLLSIQYYRMRLLVNFPLLSRFLLSRKEAPNELAKHSRLVQELPRIIHDDWGAARELCGMISALSKPSETFTSTFPAWYTCNYAMLTVALHYFAILLVIKHVPEVLDIASVALVRQGMGEALCAMEWFGKSSLITQKAGCCIERLLNVFDTLENQPEMVQSASIDIWDTDFMLQNLEQHSNDFLATFGQDEFDQQEPSFLDLYSCIPLCE